MGGRANFCYFWRILALFVKNVKNGPYHPFLEFFLGIKEWRTGFFYSWLWIYKHRKIFFQLFFSKFQRTRYPGVPQMTTPRGKNPQNVFFWFKFFSHLILWVKTKRLTPRLSIYYKKWLRYGFLKFWGYPGAPKFQTPVKPKYGPESKNIRDSWGGGTFTPKMSKIYFLRVFSLYILRWNHPIVRDIVPPVIRHVDKNKAG